LKRFFDLVNERSSNPNVGISDPLSAKAETATEAQTTPPREGFGLSTDTVTGLIC
jgi:hypothetical protein